MAKMKSGEPFRYGYSVQLRQDEIEAIVSHRRGTEMVEAMAAFKMRDDTGLDRDMFFELLIFVFFFLKIEIYVVFFCFGDIFF